MEVHAQKKVAGLLLGFVLCLALISVSVATGKKKGGKMLGSADKVWSTMVSSGFLKPDEVIDCRAERQCIGILSEKWRRSEKPQKIHLLPKFRNLGGQILEAEGEVPARIGPYLIVDEIVSLLVEALNAEDPEVRDEACRILANDTPDSLVRNHTSLIEKAWVTFPEIAGGALLIGKLGNQRALELFGVSHELQKTDSIEVQAVFGKLGQLEKEAALVTAYQNETDPKEKRNLAWYLGYMAQPKSLIALAGDLRSPFAYEWNQKAKRTFRIHVISALSRAYPREPLLWKPFFRPTGDEYYASIETWAEQTLGIEWNQPRPPFLYEQDVPMRKPASR